MKSHGMEIEEKIRSFEQSVIDTLEDHLAGRPVEDIFRGLPEQELRSGILSDETRPKEFTKDILYQAHGRSLVDAYTQTMLAAIVMRKRMEEELARRHNRKTKEKK